MDTAGNPAQELIPLDPKWKLVDLNSVTHGGIETLQDSANVALAGLIDGANLIRGSATLASELRMVGVQRKDLQLTTVTSSGPQPLSTNASHTRWITLHPARADQAEGMSYLGARLSGSRGYLPYQLPIFDLRTGRVAGIFGAVQIRLEQGPRLKRALAEFHDKLRGSAILDASYSDGSLMVLAASRGNARKLYHISGRGVAERVLCGPESRLDAPGAALVNSRSRTRPDAPVIRTFTLTERGRETSEPGRTILTHYQLGATRSPEALVYFHGGPGGSLADNYFPEVVERTLSAGRDVIIVEYSGSLGGDIGLASRIGRQGITAFDQDVDAMAAWLQRQGYDRVTLLAASFGGPVGLRAVQRHRSLFSRSVFVAPLLRLQDPKKWVARGAGLASVAADTQLAYERAFLGGDEGRATFATGLETVLAHVDLGPDVHFFFGDLDDISKAEHLPPNISARVRILPRTVHAATLAHEAVWNAVLAGRSERPN